MKKLKFCAIVIPLSLSAIAHAESQEEVNKQIAKLIGDAVSGRLASTTGTATTQLQPPNNLWGSYTRLRVDPDTTSTIDTDIGVIGYDRDLTASWVAGVAASYNHSSEFSGRGWSVSPYLAYRITNEIFAVGRLAYSEFDFKGGNGHTTAVAASLNGIHPFGNAYGQWRTEVNFGDSRTETSGNQASSSTTYIADGELGYYFSGRLKPFAGLQLTRTNRPDTYSAYARLGIEKELSKDAALGIKYERKIDDDYAGNEDITVDSLTLTARMRF